MATRTFPELMWGSFWTAVQAERGSYDITAPILLRFRNARCPCQALAPRPPQLSLTARVASKPGPVGSGR
eukprot:10103138-Alexandrium_andersonii.AAC.1